MGRPLSFATPSFKRAVLFPPGSGDRSSEDDRSGHGVGASRPRSGRPSGLTPNLPRSSERHCWHPQSGPGVTGEEL